MEGVLIREVRSGSAAEKAGLRSAGYDARGRMVGDLIVAVDGQPVRTSRDLYRFLDVREVGDRVVLSVWRRKGRSISN